MFSDAVGREEEATRACNLPPLPLRPPSPPLLTLLALLIVLLILRPLPNVAQVSGLRVNTVTCQPLNSQPKEQRAPG